MLLVLLLPSSSNSTSNKLQFTVTVQENLIWISLRVKKGLRWEYPASYAFQMVAVEQDVLVVCEAAALRITFLLLEFISEKRSANKA
jgi:hypothetical protein